MCLDFLRASGSTSWFCIGITNGDHPILILWHKSICVYDRCVLVIIFIIGEVDRGLDLLVLGGKIVADGGRSISFLGKNLEVESSHYAEVFRPTFEREAETRI